MQTEQYDVCIIGGGMVGLALARSLGDQGLSILVIEGSSLQLEWPPDSFPLRVSAINRQSRRLLENLGVWQQLTVETATPYTDMKVWDAVGKGQISLSCLDVGETELGHIVENRALVRALYLSLEEHPRVSIHLQKPVHTIEGEPGNWKIGVSGGETFMATLIVGADGARSRVREQMGFTHEERAYGQNAIVAVIELEQTHSNTAWQRFLPSGPLAFLPLHHPRRCSIVWSCTQERAEALMGLDESAFCEQLAEAMEGRFGTISLCTRAVQFPLTARHAHAYCQEGVALVGDAAHTIHPLAGQGVNLGFMDVAALSQVLGEAFHRKRLLAALSTLEKYQARRWWANQAVLTTMNMFKTGFSNSCTPLGVIRSLGLDISDRIKPVKKFFIYRAMGI